MRLIDTALVISMTSKYIPAHNSGSLWQDSHLCRQINPVSGSLTTHESLPAFVRGFCLFSEQTKKASEVDASEAL
jgi:hypothetical protein